MPVRPAARPPVFWAPGVLALALPAFEIARSLRDPWFTEAAFWAHHRALNGAAALSWVAAALMLVPAARAAILAHLDGFDAMAPRRRAAWLWLAWLGLLAELAWLKVCQFRGYQLPLDTAATVNIAHNLAYHGMMESAVLGVRSYFAVHCMPVLALVAPLLRLWDHAAPLLAVQVAVLASIPPAAFLLTRRLSGSAAAGAGAFWLVVMSSFFWDLASASLALQTHLPAYFLWGVLFALGGRPWAAGAMLALTLLTIEQAPFVAAGLCLYWAAARRDRRSLALGAAGCAACAALFLGEAALIRSYPESASFAYWGLFSRLGEGPSSWLGLLWPSGRWEPLWRQLYTTGFLPLLAPLHLLPWALNYFPNFVSELGTFYQRVVLHYPAYIVGPLWWALAAGLTRAWGWAGERRWALLAWVLLCAGFGAHMAPRTLMPNWAKPHFQRGRAVLEQVSPGASVWTGQWASAALAARRHIKTLPYADDPAFHRMLFMPDYILLDKDWFIRVDRGLRSRVAALVKAERYVQAVAEGPMVLMRHPRAPLGAPPLALPDAMPGIDFKVELH